MSLHPGSIAYHRTPPIGFLSTQVHKSLDQCHPTVDSGFRVPAEITSMCTALDVFRRMQIVIPLPHADSIVAVLTRLIVSVVHPQPRRIEANFSHKGCYLEDKPCNWIKPFEGNDTLVHLLSSRSVSSVCKATSPCLHGR